VQPCRTTHPLEGGFIDDCKDHLREFTTPFLERPKRSINHSLAERKPCGHCVNSDRNSVHGLNQDNGVLLLQKN